MMFSNRSTSRGIPGRTCVPGVVLAALFLAAPIAGQEPERTPLGVWDVSVDSIVQVMRSGKLAAASQARKLSAHLVNEPDSWPRPRVDSLAIGITRVLLENRYMVMTSRLTRILGLQAPDGATVGTPEQLIRLAEAGRSLENLQRSAVLRMMPPLAEDPTIVAYLESVATSEGEVDSQLERSNATLVLTTSRAGRARLRQMWAEGSVQDRAARLLMERLSKSDFEDSLKTFRGG